MATTRRRRQQRRRKIGTSIGTSQGVYRLDKKYYCGMRDLETSEWTRDSTAKAVAHARDILVAEPTRDKVFIVQVIGVVRRANLPIEIQKVV